MTSDAKIEPALSAEEWERADCPYDREGSAHSKTVAQTIGNWAACELQTMAQGDLATAMIAIGNHILAVGHPLKLTREDVDKLTALVKATGSYCDRGPAPNGWQSDELIAVVAAGHALAAKIEALLPPK